MSDLDQPDLWQSRDPGNMRGLISALPEHVRAAAEEIPLLRLRSPVKPNLILVTGLGGSAIGGDVVRCAVSQSLRVPLVVNRDYGVPACVGSSALVIACSYSGNTEETLSAYEAARQAGAAIVCIASGGELAARGARDSVPVIAIPGGLPPRAALGYSSILLLGVLVSLGLQEEMTQDLQETSALLKELSARWSVKAPEEHNEAKQLARSLTGKIVAVYGSSGLLEAAAARWRGQIEENAKNLSFHHCLPEMNHNELVGWAQPPSVLRQAGAVLLRDRGDHPQVQRRFELTRECLEPVAAGVHEVWSRGESRLARIFSVMYMGDYVSLYLAFLNGVDPTPVEVIENFKQKLRQE